MPDSNCRAARSGTELRRQLLDEFPLESSAQLALLDCACCALDQARAAEAIIAKEGLIALGARGPVPHPAVQICKDSRHRLMRALRQLDLDNLTPRDGYY